MRLLAVALALATVGSAGWFTACGGRVTPAESDGGTPDGGSSDATSASEAACPIERPSGECLPGQTCDYACEGTHAVCNNGIWESQFAPAPASPDCPSVEPVEGTPCAWECGAVRAYGCTYGVCCIDAGGIECIQGAWRKGSSFGLACPLCPR